MSEDRTEKSKRQMREINVQYVVNTQGQRVAVVLPLEEYNHYLDLLDDEADSEDSELAERLAQAASQVTGGERQSLRDYLRQRGLDDGHSPG